MRLRHQVHTFVAFIDIRKAFDSCWVEATLVRLHDVGISGRLFGISLAISSAALPRSVWATQFPNHGDSGVAQGRVFSPLLFNLLVDSFATSLRAAVPGVHLVDSDPFRQESQPIFRMLWTSCIRGVFVGSSRWVLAQPSRRLWSSVLSAAALIVPCILGASLSLWCHNTGTSVSLLLPLSLGVLTLTWSALVVIASSTKLAPGVVAKVCISLSPFVTYVLSSSSFGLEFFGDDSAALQQLNLSLRRWCRHLLGWPSASLVAAVHWELGIGDALRLAL